ncbi:MAG: ATP-binding cassette domain-containing protein [Oscillibacter sp.]|nr:ATP-binding cassette domain-containing protein [Oscillibacter sp.]
MGIDHATTAVQDDVILDVRHLKQYFGKADFKAVDDVSFSVKKGEVFGLVGESGCGKTTTGRSIIRLYNITSGDVYFKGRRIAAGTRSYTDAIAAEKKASASRVEELKKAGNQDAVRKEQERLSAFIREQKAAMAQAKADQKQADKEKLSTKIQMIFQDPIASLNPRMTVREIIAEGLRIQGVKDENFINEQVYKMLETVGLVREHADRYPHEFSGGQRQRIGIARAIIMNPDLIIADEPISALDVSIQAQVINLLNDLRTEMGLTILFIAHDLSVVKYFSDRIAVMYFGKIVEMADSDELFAHPLHPYTKSLLSAIPLPDPRYERRRKRIVYEPVLDHDYSKEGPTFREITPGHFVSCNTEEFRRYEEAVK